MIRIARNANRPKAENTVALVNIVFLMLIFFLIAGAITPPIDNEISLIKASEALPVAPPDALAVRQDGTLIYRGEVTTAVRFAETRPATDETADPALKLIADRALPAEKLIEIISELKAAGAVKIAVVTERDSR